VSLQVHAVFPFASVFTPQPCGPQLPLQVVIDQTSPDLVATPTQPANGALAPRTMDGATIGKRNIANPITGIPFLSESNARRVIACLQDSPMRLGPWPFAKDRGKCGDRRLYHLENAPHTDPPPTFRDSPARPPPEAIPLLGHKRFYALSVSGTGLSGPPVDRLTWSTPAR